MGDASASTFVWRARTLRGCAGRGNRMGGPRWSRVSCHQTERAASAELKPQATCAFPRIAEVAPPSSPGPTDDGVWKRYADRGRRTHPTFETDMTLAAGQEMPDSRQLLMRPVIRRCCRSISSMERLARCSTESDGCRSAGSRRDSAVGSPEESLELSQTSPTVLQRGHGMCCHVREGLTLTRNAPTFDRDLLRARPTIEGEPPGLRSSGKRGLRSTTENGVTREQHGSFRCGRDLEAERVVCAPGRGDDTDLAAV
jgi:hypothetical protein